MVKTAPAPSLVVSETDFLLEFEIVALNPPAQLGLIDHAFKRDVGRQRGEPIVIRFGFTLRPFINSHSSSAGSLRLASSCAGRTRHRANREVSGVLLPSRHLICCQADTTLEATQRPIVPNISLMRKFVAHRQSLQLLVAA
jgi:hypothetical protein